MDRRADELRDAPGADVDRGAGDRAGRGHAAEQRRGEVRQALAEQLPVRDRRVARRSSRRRRWPRAGSPARRARRSRARTGSIAPNVAGIEEAQRRRRQPARECRRSGRRRAANTCATTRRGGRRPGARTARPGARARRASMIAATPSAIAIDRRPTGAPTNVATASAATAPDVVARRTSVTPSAAGTCCRAITTAMPAVKPSTTGIGR